MNSNAQKGKRIITAICATMVLVTSGALAFSIFQGATDRLLSQGLKSVLVVTLCYFMYQGNNFARRVAATYAILSSVICGFGLVLTFPLYADMAWILALFMIYAVMAALLLDSSYVHAFFDDHKTGDDHRPQGLTS